MRLYGLIGHPLSHSFSPAYFKEKFKREDIYATYKAFDLPQIESFFGLLSQYPSLKGLNVTIPYKEQIIPYLDFLTPLAQEVSAVNTIQFLNNKLIGHNTDVVGFTNSLRPLLTAQHRTALIFGTGGASKAIQVALKHLEIEFTVVSRSTCDRTISYAQLNEEIIAENLILINTTPVGTYPDVNQELSIPYKGITATHIAFDLIYNPAKTAFLNLAQEQGATIKSGLEMLHLQAEASWKIWNQK